MKNLKELRIDLNRIDDKILDLLIERFKITNEVGDYKAKNAMPPINEDREKAIFDSLTEKAISRDLNPDLILKVWRDIIDEVIDNHKEKLNSFIN